MTERLILGDGSASDWSVRRITKTPCSFRVHGVDYLIVDGLGFD